MNKMASQITGVLIVYPTVCSGADQRKHQSPTSLAFVGNSQVVGEFPAQRANNAEIVSIWWRHHILYLNQIHTSFEIGYPTSTQYSIAL